MSTRNNPPLTKSDPSLLPNDTGDAVKLLQDFLQTLPEVKRQQDLLADFGKSYSLTDGNHYGKLDIDTGKALADYQDKNKTRIMKAGQLDEQGYQKEKNTVGYSTWKIILEDQGKSSSMQSKLVPEKKVEPPQEQNKSLEGKSKNKLLDPPKANNNKDATYYVKTKDVKSRLALRLAPAYEKVSKDASEDGDKKGDLVIMMPNETLVKVIEYGIGYNCEWSEVEVVDEDPIFDNAKNIQKESSLYCYSEFLHPLKKTDPLLPITCEDCSENNNKERKTLFPEWKTLDSCEPFYDEETCSYYITIELEDTSSDEKRIDTQKKNALFRGIKALLEFYDKQRDEDTVNKYYKSGPSTIEYYLDKRPQSKMQFLIKFPAKFFDAIPRNSDNLDDIPNAESGKVPQEWRTLNLEYSTISEQIEIASKIIQDYEDDTSKWKGEIVDFSFFDEAERLRWFIPTFDWFLDKNKVKRQEGDIYEIGFEGPCFNIKYVLLYKEGLPSAYPLRKGFNCFMKKEPIRYQRTMGYLFYLSEIIKDFEQGRKTWSEFIHLYTCPIPEIKPSKQSSKKKRERHWEYEEKLIKNTSEKKVEDNKIHDPSFKQQKAKERKNLRHYVGDNLLSCDNIENLIGKIGDIDSLYEEVLNKVDIGSITSFVASCLASRFAPPDLYNTMCKSAFKNLEFEQLQQILDFFDNSTVVKVRNESRKLEKTRSVSNNSELLRRSIEKVSSEEQICKAMYSLDPELVVSKINNLSFNLQKDVKKLLRKQDIPTISISDGMHTEDIMSSIGEAIISAVKYALAGALISLVKEIFRSLCEQCSPINGPQKYGDFNINDAIPRGKNPFQDFGACDNINDISRNFLDDLSSILLPSEICDLLNGTASKDLLDLVFNFMKSKYPMLEKCLYNTSILKDFFKHLGDNMDFNFCDNLGEIEIIQDNLCFDLENDLRKDMLNGRMSSSQIDEQLKNIKERDKEKLSKLSDLLDGSILKDIPQMNNCKEGNKNKAFTKEHESVEHLNETIIETIFNNVYSTFNFDMNNFIYAIVNNGKNKIKEFDLKKSQDSINMGRKQLEEGQNLTDDPMGTGETRGKDKNSIKNSFIAEDIKNALVSSQNRHKFGQDLSNDIAAYDFTGQVQLSDGMRKVLEKLSVNQKGVNVPIDVNIDKLYPNQECDEDIFKLSPNTLIRYYLPPYSIENKELQDQFSIMINDAKLRNLIIVDGKNDLEESVKSFSSKYMSNLSNGISIQQQLFANFVSNIWTKVVDDKTRDKITKKDSDFYKLFRDDIFHKISLDTLNTISYVIGSSKLFNLKDFENIKFIEDSFSSNFGTNFCPPNHDNNLLNINNIKDSIKDKNEQLANSCESLTANSSNQQFSSIEKSNLAGVIETIIRLYVIEYLLRGMFVFSEFEINSLVKDDTISKYLIENIIEDMKRQGDGFYESFSLKVKDYVIDRGMKLIDPFRRDNPEEKENEILKNELHPKNINGEAFIEFCIKEQILNISNNFKDMFGIDVENIDNKIFNSPEQEMNMELTLDLLGGGYADNDILDVPKDIKKDNKFIDVVFPESNILGAKIKRVIMPKFGYMNGKIEFEKYVRLVNDHGMEVDKIISVNEFQSMALIERDKYCGFYGIRLIYVIPFSEKSKNIMKQIQLQPGITDKFKSYMVDDGESFCFPLISIEYEKEIFESYQLTHGKNEEQFLITPLKKKMFDMPEYKFLFHYIFSFPRSLTLMTIYNILLMSKSIDNIDYCFENTKRFLRTLFRATHPNKEWWKETDPEIVKMGGNEGRYQDMMNNAKTSGCNPSVASMAAMTIPIMIKGLAESQDPAYKLIKQLFDNGMADLSWGDVWRVMPCNLIPIIGFGPPLLAYGAMALSYGLLSGEKRDKEKRDREKNALNNIESCKKGENK